MHWIRATTGPRVAQVTEYRNRPEQVEQLGEWLADDMTVFFIHRGDLLKNPPPGAKLAFVGRFETTAADSPLNVYRVVGAEDELANAVADHCIADPNLLTESLIPLEGMLGAQETTYVFPARLQERIAALTGGTVQPISIDEWPLTAARASGIVASQFSETKQDVAVVIFDDPTGCPSSQTLSLALVRRQYRYGSQWAGGFRVWYTVTGPADPELHPLAVEFADSIRLRGASVIDSSLMPGDAVRIAVQWETAVAIKDSFRVFAHVFDADGNLRAQYDSVPGDGLLPMTGWQPGETVEDRFAITLPGDLPPGRYEVRLGIYHPDSGLRLPVTGGADSGDSVVIGTFSVGSGG
jgi:hypothetical protein